MGNKGQWRVRVCDFFSKRLLMILTVLSIVLGFTIGFVVRPAKPSADALMWMALPGDVFLSLLKMPIIPLIISSIITATASMEPRKNGKLGLMCVFLHMGSNFIGSGLGLILAVGINPGKGVGNDTAELRAATSQMQPQDIAADMIRNLFPSNVVRATFQKAVTKYETKEVVDAVNGSVVYETSKSVEYTDAMNIIGLVFCSVMFGLATAKAKDKGKPVLLFFQSATEIIMVILQWFLWVAPIGIISLISASVAAITDLESMFIKLGLFVATVLTGLFIHQVFIQPLLYLIATRKNPLKIHLANMKAWFVAFASASSAGAMPYLYEACKKLQIGDGVAIFGVPIGVTLNATGSSMFICSALVFLAEVNQIALNGGQMLIAFVLTSLSSMALPSVPSASLVFIVILCSTFGLPTASIGLLFAVEWLLDRIRTTSNVVAEIFILDFIWHVLKDDFTTEVKDTEEVQEDENGPLSAVNSTTVELFNNKTKSYPRGDEVVVNTLL